MSRCDALAPARRLLRILALAALPAMPGSFTLVAQEPPQQNASSADAQTIAKLIGQLADESFQVREDATEKLIASGEPARQQLLKLQNEGTTDYEVAMRIRTALEGLDRREDEALAWLYRQRDDKACPARAPIVIQKERYDGPMLRLFDLAAGREVASAVVDAPIGDIRFSADGSALHTADLRSTVTTWTTDKLQKVKFFSNPPTPQAGSAPGSSRVVVLSADASLWAEASNQGTIRVLETSAGKLQHEFARRGGTLSLALSAQGRLLAAAGGCNVSVDIFDLTAGVRQHSIACGCGRTGLAFSPDGQRLMVGRRDGVVIYDPATGQEQFTIADAEATGPLAFSPDGKWLAAVVKNSCVVFWNPRTGRKIRGWAPGAKQAGNAAAIRELHFSGDGRRLETSSGPTVRVWNLESDPLEYLEVTIRPPANFAGLALTAARLSHDGKWLATAEDCATTASK